MQPEGSLMCPQELATFTVPSQISPIPALLSYTRNVHVTAHVSSDCSVFPDFLFVVRYNESNTTFRELNRRPCSDWRMGMNPLSCPTGRDVLDSGPVADDFRQADLLSLLAFALELRKITKKKITKIFSATICLYWLSPEKKNKPVVSPLN